MKPSAQDCEQYLRHLHLQLRSMKDHGGVMKRLTRL